MNDDEAHAAMHAAADIVGVKLRRFLTAAVLDSFDCDDILHAGQEWLDDDDDVETLRKAIDDFHNQ